MKMKQLFVSIIVLIIALMPFSLAVGTPAEILAPGANIEITFISQEPDPVEPGNFVDVRFKVDNKGSEEALVEFEVMPSFPFSLEPGKDAQRSLGILQSRQLDDEGVVVKYRLLVDENAVEGEIELPVRYRINGEAWVLLDDDFSVDIRTADAILAINSVKTDKDMLEPGSESKVTMSMSNEADSVLRNIEVTLDFDDTPFIPLGSGNQKSLYQIRAGEKQDLVFDLLTDPESTSGVYKVPVEITYLDEVGTEFSKESVIGLFVGAAPDISVTLDDTNVYQTGKAGEITIKIVNKGVSDVKFVNLKLSETEKLRIFSNNEIYLGNIDSDDFESATFDIFVEESDDGQVVLPLVLEYKDSKNNDLVDNIDIAMPVYSANEAKKFGLVQSSSSMGTIMIIIIVVAGLFFYRRYKKKKKKS